VSSIDHLRNKLRSNHQDTQELTPETGAHEAPKSFRRPSPVFTDELPGTADLDASVFQEPASPSTNAAPVSETQPKKANPLLEKLKQLEVNRKMLIIALGVAGLATLLSMSYIKGIAEPLRGQSKLIKVVTLVKDVPARTPLKEDMVQIKEIPAAYVPEGATRVEPGKTPVVLGMLTVTALYKGEMLMKERMSDPNAATGLATQIPEGHRAITVRTDNAYLMKPGDYVDVIAAIKDLNPVRRGKIISIPVLQRAKILAVGNQFTSEAGNSGNSNSMPREITVAVPDERVNLMSILEQSNGKFNVIQRAAGDQHIQTELYTIQEIEDALQGKFESTPTADTTTPTKEVKPAAKTTKEEDPTEEDISKLVDLSGGAPAAPAAPAYRAPAYRAPVYRAPVRQAPRRPAAAPAQRPAAAPARAPVRPYRAPTVIQGGVQTQGGE